ncbi:acetyl-CoA carboxylase biotin carboxyl carrier protein subunit [Pusillimonas sp. TS35]|uniref:acetyl-CoA carboxylase biotin carboxyl carrier protein subunit n=1 Tax=Paracandidimonas lactea TaxID=2895524 RepID=UPI00137053A1|nr:acetyl-CoA carboxylase biotin carboxyl carrier protein subunit [Paracandidimonas lactea]MYN13475.1 acetyl-CoA carboxylase biotin carboxyl carrier protein subunit [Pusillimonas sp. TS35]
MNTIKSIVSGTVTRIHAAPGDTLSPGDIVLTVESMKMEIPVEAETACRIREILVAEGASVNEDDDIAVVD